jgi:uncharacterized protein YndB with AHSA1/START domain
MSATAIAPEPTTTGFELSITRTFNVPRELVWRAWTDPDMAKQWMGPRGFTTTGFETSSEPGGRWHLTMTGRPPGLDHDVTLSQGGVIREVRPPELMVYTFAWDDRTSVGLPPSPFKENIVTIRFEEHDGKTIMHFHQAPFATESERDGHAKGWSSAFECLSEALYAALMDVPDAKSSPTSLAPQPQEEA